MSTTASKPVTTPIPVQLSEPEFEAFILPHLSMPKRGPKCKLGYYRVFRRFLKKNLLIQDAGAGLIKMSYLGNAGWRSNRFSTACIAAFPSEMPFW
jgi:hypothetical protein